MINAVGQGVTSLARGDLVVGLAPGCLASVVITSELLVAKIPEVGTNLNSVNNL